MKGKQRNIFLTLMILVVVPVIYYYTWFLRQPNRSTPKGDNLFISPANGNIVAVEKWDKNKLSWNKDYGIVETMTEDIGMTGWLIAIEMDITHVHYQRAPIDSQFVKRKYTKGKFNNALVKTNQFGLRLENERNDLLLQSTTGIPYKVIQVAGLLARRIEDYLTPDQLVQQGEVVGLIKLGSQVALIVPEYVVPQVKVGDKVVDGETVIGKVN